MDMAKTELLAALERRLEVSVDEAARALAGQTDAFGPIRDDALPEELRLLARQHWLTLLETARAERVPGIDEYEFARARAVQRAREMVPLPAQVRAYLVGIRTVMDTIAREAPPNVESRGAALDLIVHLMDSVVVAFSTMVEAYVETVEGERADREADRSAYLDEIVRDDEPRPELRRRAAGLGLELGHAQVLVIATDHATGPHDSRVLTRRWVAEAIGRATGRAAARTFLIVRPDDVVAVLDASGENRAELVLDRARRALVGRHGVELTAGVGTPFDDLGGVRRSYLEAQRAARHTDADHPILTSPRDISLFADLATSADPSALDLVPDPTRRALRDPVLRATLKAYVDADLSVSAAAAALVLHPNSVRYRLRRIEKETGRNPQRLTDLLELAAAARLLDGAPEG